jgi:hypothetical protein
MKMCDYIRFENVLHLLAVKNSPFSQFFFVTFEEFFGSMMVTACSMIMFKVLQVSWVIAQKENYGGIRSGNCGGQRPHLTMQSLKRSCKKAIVVSQYGWSPHLLKSAIPFTLFQQGKE